MLHRPSLRVVVATTTAAVVLVGGAQLASYATTHHGYAASTAAKTTQPKTITFSLGTNGQTFAGGTQHLYTAKVPKGKYSVSVSGFMSGLTGTNDNSYTCLLVDKKTLLHVLHSVGDFTGGQRLYSISGQDGQDSPFSFGLVSDHNPVALIDRTTVIYGCLLNGPDPFTVIRPLKFALTPVKTTNQKGQKFTISKVKARQLVHALR